MPATIKRTVKLQVRLRPSEAAAIRATTQALGITIAEAVRGWIAAGIRGDLPMEGLLMPQASEDADERTE